MSLPLLLAAMACQQDTLIASDCTEDDCVSGKALLTLEGSVEIEGDGDHSALIPALAFFNGETSTFHFVDVDVEGMFPSQFAIEVRNPPPPEVIISAPGDISWALAYLTAAEEGHPSSMRFSQLTGGEAGCWDASQCGDPADCLPPEWTPERPCEVTEMWCTVRRDECYEETRFCPAVGSPYEDCEALAGEGDASLRMNPWDQFAGLSEDLVVVYLVEPLQEGDPAARAFDHQVLDAGYHLMQLSEPDAVEREARDACSAEARDLVASRFNAEHGTGFTGDDVPGGLHCTGDAVCESWDELSGWLSEVLPAAHEELACPPLGVALRPIDAQDDIAVRIATPVSPLGQPYGGAPPRIEAPAPPEQ